MHIRLHLKAILISISLCTGCNNASRTASPPQTTPVTGSADKTVVKSSLPEPDGDFMREYERIQVMQMGLKVTNLRSHYIGCSEAKPGPWAPITNYKETLKGRLTSYSVDTGHMFDSYNGTNGKTYTQLEYDWRLMVLPAETHKEIFNDGWVLCEVTPQLNFWDNMWFPIKESGKPSILLDYDLCIYGAYVRDNGAQTRWNRPDEIHPVEAIWWERKDVPDPEIRVLLVQDAAKGRFREEPMYSRKPCDADNPDWKPWVEYPQLQEIKIPFSYDPADKKFTDIKLQVLRALDISTQLQTNWRDNDDGAQHQLFLATDPRQTTLGNLPVIIRVTEDDNTNKHIAVQFTDLTCDSRGIIRGYVKLLVALGDSAQQHEGIMVFNVTFRKIKNEITPASQEYSR